MKLAQLIRAKREQRQLSIREIAEAVGTTPSYLYELEQGKTVNIRLPLAAKLSQVLKIPLTSMGDAAVAEESRKSAAVKRAKRSAR